MPPDTVPKLAINNDTTERVATFKLLGVYFNNDLTWSNHVNYIASKAGKRIYSIGSFVQVSLSKTLLSTVQLFVLYSIIAVKSGTLV